MYDYREQKYELLDWINDLKIKYYTQSEDSCLSYEKKIKIRHKIIKLTRLLERLKQSHDEIIKKNTVIYKAW